MKGWSQWLLLMFFALFVVFFFLTLFHFPVVGRCSLDVFSSALYMTLIEVVRSIGGDYSFIGLVAIWFGITNTSAKIDRVCNIGNSIRMSDRNVNAEFLVRTRFPSIFVACVEIFNFIYSTFSNKNNAQIFFHFSLCAIGE